MIDLHHHCLPAVDDGPDDWESSVDQCRSSSREGVHTIVATPHVLREPWINDHPATLRSLVAELNDRLGGEPRILPGCEYMFAGDVLERISSGSIIPLAESRYFLTEFPAASIPEDLDRILFEIGLAGHVPILAHPERNRRVQEDPGVLTGMIARGARMQLTAGSLVGRFGEPSQLTAFELLDREMAHFIATDAHDLVRRPPLAFAGIHALTERYGTERAQLLTETNPLAVVENRPLPYEPEARPRARRGVLSKLRSWLL